MDYKTSKDFKKTYEYNPPQMVSVPLLVQKDLQQMVKQINGLSATMGNHELFHFQVTMYKALMNYYDLLQQCHDYSEAERVMGISLIHWATWELREADPYTTLHINYPSPLPYANKNRYIDFYLKNYTPPYHSLAIEVDGDYHTHPKVKARDQQKDEYLLKKHGVSTLRFPGVEVYKNTAKCLQTVQDTWKLIRGY